MVDVVKNYAKFVSNRPGLVLILALIVTFIGVLFYGNLSVSNPDISEILPEDLPVVQGLNKVSDDLGGGQTTAFMVVVELDSVDGGEINDIRDPEVSKYTYILSKQIQKVQDITGTNSLGEIMYQINEDKHINSLTEMKSKFDENSEFFSRIVNDKYSLTIIRVYAAEGFDVGILEEEVSKIIENTPKPVGVEVKLAGEAIAQKISEDLTGPDSAKTSMISLVAIVVILLLTFRSLIYGSLPLFTILFGVLWTFGFMAISGLNMSSFSSGAISMIIGIGIDFGIQIIMRFKQELEQSKPVIAMENTIENVLKPMSQATVAAFIGFFSMTLGDFAIVGELGKIMAIGVVFCFFAAATVVPAISVLYEIHKPSYKFNSPAKVLKRLKMLIKKEVKL